MIYPSIFTDSLTTAQTQLEIAQRHTQLSALHVDIIDGFFTDTPTIVPLSLPELDWGTLLCDIHLMVEEPLDFVFEISGMREYIPVRAMIAQVERMSWQSEYIDEVKRQGWKVGLSLDIFTPLEAIDEESWERLDVIQLMAIEAGYHDQPFKPQVLTKLAELVEHVKAQQLELEVIVDGAINLDNAPKLLQHGATSLVVGGSIWKAEEPLKAVDSFFSLLSK